MTHNEEEIRAHLNGDVPEQDARPPKKFGKEFAITVLIALAMAISLSVWRGLFEQTDVAGVFRVLSDSFLIPGALFAGIGGLTWVASYGFFDIMSYGCSAVFGRFIPFDSAYRRKENYYDYRQKKEAKGRTWKKDMVFSGLTFILLSILFSVIYSCL